MPHDVLKPALLIVGFGNGQDNSPFSYYRGKFKKYAVDYIENGLGGGPVHARPRICAMQRLHRDILHKFVCFVMLRWSILVSRKLRLIFCDAGLLF